MTETITWPSFLNYAMRSNDLSLKISLALQHQHPKQPEFYVVDSTTGNTRAFTKRSPLVRTGISWQHN